MHRVARSVGSGVVVVLVPLLFASGCARTAQLDAMLEESRVALEAAREAERQAIRTRVRAEAAEREAAEARAAAARTRALSDALRSAPALALATPLLAADRVVVHKAARRLELYRKGALLRVFPVALGFEPVGSKRRQGDGRTPEGRYVVDGRWRTRRFGRALHISYPRPQDVRRARAAGVAPGGGIFIHGLPEGLGLIGSDHARFDWTNGCIAVTDEQLDEIWARVADGTPIEILP